jgi:CRISPR-associated protein Csd1
MILEALMQYYEILARQGKVPLRNWSRAGVSDRLMLDDSGCLVGIVSAKVMAQRGKKEVEVDSQLLVPERMKKTSGIRPQFLCDSAYVLLGVDFSAETGSPSGKSTRQRNPQRAIKSFEASREFHQKILRGCTSKEAKALLKFFDSWNPETALSHPVVVKNHEELSTSTNLIFNVDGQDVQEVPDVKEAWNTYQEEKQKEAIRGQCLVTGEEDVPIAVLHPNIKGVQGAQASGASFVTFNKRAFESYGHTDGQGLNAPVSKEAAFAYTTALNYLLQSDNKVYLGDTTIVFWAQNGEEAYQTFSSNFFSDKPTADADDATIRTVLRKMASGQPADFNGHSLNPETTFYILGIAPNASRLSIRFIWRDSFGSFLQHMYEHQKRMELIGPTWETKKILSLKRITRATVNPHSKDDASSPLLTGSLIRSILTGMPYPEALYRNIILRIYADHDDSEKEITKVSYVRAAIIKAYLLRNCKKGWVKNITMAVNENCNEIAYVLGRLFSVLENLQITANPDVNTTIKDRYFNAACATPSVAFAPLLKLANAHLGKLDERKGTFFRKKIGQLLDKIAVTDSGTAIPARLSMDEQGLFILGYYQETQVRFSKKEDK